MDFVIDNAVALSAILLGVLVVGGLVVLGIAGLQLWRRLKKAKGRVTVAAAALTAESDRMQAALATLPDRQTELTDAVSSLQRRVAVLNVLAGSLNEAADVLRAPLRFIGR